ncbi:MAG: hypothetical protein ABI700_09865, partial [Chloroflexota bacterium]
VQGVQTNFIDSLKEGSQFTAQGIKTTDGVTKYPYSQLVAFEIDTNGHVQLLEQIPPALLPDGATTNAYDPKARILYGGTSEPIPYFH